ncbi:MAG: alpha-glucosidase/alpha-galactosidase [Clostridia bacterium]|nr:alpha-glucosidase/alpha-galactosidase [Clostridia bacterium]
MQQAKDVRIAYIGGGSRGWAWGLMTDIALDPVLAGEVRLYDIDRDAAEKNQKIGELISSHPKAVSHWRYTVADSLQAALTGADFVIISILPATFDEMESDVHAPEAVGVYQSVGDTVGPGGFMRALRTIPMFEEIARAIRAYAPDAWVINYTNPMSLCVATLYRVFPEIRAFGCCHEVFGTQKLLSAMLEDMEGIPAVPRQEIRVTVQGINHFTWFSKASYEGQDLFPVYRAFCEKYAATGFLKGQDDNWMNNYFACSHRVKMDLFLKYGKIAAAGDRHLAEFMPPWYLRDPETARSWGFSLTPVSWRKQDLQNRLARRERLLSGQEDPDFKGSDEEGHLMLGALLGLGDMTTNVNIPNRGQIPNLPLGAIVETNALFRAGEIAPVYAGPMDGNIQALTARHVLNQQNTLQAALTCDRGLALTTFMNDPLMSRVDWADGERLFDRMLAAQRAYLPAGWFSRAAD